MKYESNVLKRLIDTYGVVGNPRYISEIIKEFIVRGKECFPDLFTYQSDWLAHIDEFGLNPTYTVSYTGQSFYAPNTLERPVKSAILKGQTLVNVANGGESIPLLGGNRVNSIATLYPLKTNTKMLIKFNSDVALSSGFCTLYFTDVNGNNIFSKNSNIINGNNSFIFTTPLEDVVYNFKIYTNLTGIADSALISNLQIFEYQDGMENWDIPYFTGMQSVKLPVLKTLNNIVDFSNEKLEFEYGVYLGQNDNGTDWVNNKGVSSSFVYTLNYIEVLRDKDKMRCYGNDTIIDRVVWFDKDKNQIALSVGGNNKTLNIPTGTKYFRFLLNDSRFKVNKELAKDNIGHYNFYYGDENKSFNNEPYKSNILTVNEDVTLRGNVYVNGELKEDTLDLVSGEHSISVGEVVLNGSENWSVWYHTDTLLRFMLDYSNMSNLTNIKLQCDKIPSYGYNQNAEGLYGNGGKLYLIIDNSGNKLLGNTVDDLKTYLSQNPITVQYPLKEKSIKTVDLTILDQNGQSVKQLMSFNGGTHFNTGSLEGSLLPTLEVSVETDLEETLAVCSLDGNTM